MNVLSARIWTLRTVLNSSDLEPFQSLFASEDVEDDILPHVKNCFSSTRSVAGVGISVEVDQPIMGPRPYVQMDFQTKYEIHPTKLSSHLAATWYSTMFGTLRTDPSSCLTVLLPTELKATCLATWSYLSASSHPNIYLPMICLHVYMTSSRQPSPRWNPLGLSSYLSTISKYF